MKPAEDPRWRKLNEGGAVCSCGQTHSEMLQPIHDWPGGWTHGAKIEPNNAVRVKGDFLSDDFCVVEGKYFHVRAILELPLKGLDKKLGFIAWSNLASNDFAAYVQAAMKGQVPGKGKASGRLMVRLLGYPDTYALKLFLHDRPKPLRPLMVLEDDKHPLVQDQRQGIDLDRLFDIYAAYGHDMRPAFKSPDFKSNGGGLFGKRR
jgi:hypothetical protein